MASFSGRGGLRLVSLLGLAALGACGGRTSTLIDDNDPSLDPSLPSNTAGTSGGGSTSTAPSGPHTAGASSVPVGVGGVTSTPAGGAPSAGGATSGVAGSPTGVGGSVGVGGTGPLTSAAQACSEFCSKINNNPCAGEFGSQSDCTLGCTDSLSASSACTPIGQAVLNCYTPIFTANAGHCASVSARAARTCAAQVQAFQECVGANTDPGPPPPVSCSSSGSGGANFCTMNSSCTDGTFYLVNCKQAGANQAVCTCATSLGSNTQFTLNEGIEIACQDATVSCGAPQL